MEIGENLSRALRDTYQIYLASCSNLGLGNFPHTPIRMVIPAIIDANNIASLITIEATTNVTNGSK